MFILELDTQNAAFDEHAGEEIARLLRQIAKSMERIDGGTCEAPIYDSNGNRCGRYRYAATETV